MTTLIARSIQFGRPTATGSRTPNAWTATCGPFFCMNWPAQTAHQITDGLSDATSACFSLDGKYLFFAASTNYGLNTGWLDLSSHERPIQHSLYVVVLNKQEKSPFFARKR